MDLNRGLAQRPQRGFSSFANKVASTKHVLSRRLFLLTRVQ